MSISDPAFAEFFNVGNPNYTGVSVGEQTAMSIPAVWRAVTLISGTIASLPARTIQHNDDGTRQRVSSWADDPGWQQTAYEFWETVLVHLLLHGNAFLLHILNGAGGVSAMLPIHPVNVGVNYDPETNMKTYRVVLAKGETRELTDLDLTHIPALSADGIRGLSPIAVGRNSFGTSIAAQRAAARMFGQGAMHSGIVTPEEDLTEDEATTIKESLQRKVGGWDNAGDIAVINRKLKFTPWTMSLEDAQFLQSRQFEIEEIARWFGVPPYELMQTEKQTSWGTGIEAQQRGLARQVLGPWTRRIEQRINRVLPSRRKLEFDFSGLERPTPEQEIELLLKQVDGGLLTLNEARAVRNLPPVEGGDVVGKPTEDKADSLARTLQQIYLAVGTVISVEEARRIVSESSGFPLPGALPKPQEDLVDA